MNIGPLHSLTLVIHLGDLSAWSLMLVMLSPHLSLGLPLITGRINPKYHINVDKKGQALQSASLNPRSKFQCPHFER